MRAARGRATAGVEDRRTSGPGVVGYKQLIAIRETKPGKPWPLAHFEPVSYGPTSNDSEPVPRAGTNRIGQSQYLPLRWIEHKRHVEDSVSPLPIAAGTAGDL